MGFSSQPIRWWIYFLSSVISMVAPTWCHGRIWGNPLWENVDRFDLWIDTFNSVIRLCKGEPSALFRVSPVVSLLFNSWPLCRAITHFVTDACVAWSCVNNFFPAVLERLKPMHHMVQVTGHAFRCGFLSFCFFGEVNQLCTQFGRFDSRSMPTCG